MATTSTEDKATGRTKGPWLTFEMVLEMLPALMDAYANGKLDQFIRDLLGEYEPTWVRIDRSGKNGRSANVVAGERTDSLRELVGGLISHLAKARAELEFTQATHVSPSEVDKLKEELRRLNERIDGFGQGQDRRFGEEWRSIILAQFAAKLGRAHRSLVESDGQLVADFGRGWEVALPLYPISDKVARGIITAPHGSSSELVLWVGPGGLTDMQQDEVGQLIRAHEPQKKGRRKAGRGRNGGRGHQPAGVQTRTPPGI